VFFAPKYRKSFLKYKISGIIRIRVLKKLKGRKSLLINSTSVFVVQVVTPYGFGRLFKVVVKESAREVIFALLFISNVM
jgi:hypothetical protein